MSCVGTVPTSSNLFFSLSKYVSKPSLALQWIARGTHMHYVIHTCWGRGRGASATMCQYDNIDWTNQKLTVSMLHQLTQTSAMRQNTRTKRDTKPGHQTLITHPQCVPLT